MPIQLNEEDGGKNAEAEHRKQHEPYTEGRDRQAGMQVEGERRIAIRGPAHEDAAGRAAQLKRAQRAAGNQHRILKKDLTNKPGAACPERHTDAELMCARMEPRQLKVGEIKATHQKNGNGKRHE